MISSPGLLSMDACVVLLRESVSFMEPDLAKQKTPSKVAELRQGAPGPRRAVAAARPGRRVGALDFRTFATPVAYVLRGRQAVPGALGGVAATRALKFRRP